MTARPRRRLLPATVRWRLSALYAVLFLGAGSVLLVVTYGLVANSLPGDSGAKLSSLQQQKAIFACKVAANGAEAQPTPGAQQAAAPPATKVTVPGTSAKVAPRPLPAACRAVFAAGARSAAAEQRTRTLHDLLLFSLLALAAMTAASAALGWVVAGRVLRPVRAITDAARRASERHLGERLRLQGPRDELKVLADTFDDMLDRLDAAFAGQRRFVADASHELRTPLTVMRTAVDVTLAKPDRTPAQLEAMAQKVRHSVDQAQALIDALLTLSTSQDAAAAGNAPADVVALDELVATARDELEEQAAAIDLTWHVVLGPCEVRGDRLLLERMVANLLDNAVRHNDEHGVVEVETGTTAGAAFLRVANSGPTVAPELVPSLFEPFRRVEVRTHVRDGVGIGLAIVRSVADAHGATVEATARSGGGLEIVVEFPAPAGERPVGAEA